MRFARAIRGISSGIWQHLFKCDSLFMVSGYQKQEVQMKNKFVSLGMAMLLAFALVMAGCPADADSGGTGISLIGGKIGNTLKFFVNAVSGGSLFSVRAAATGEPYPVEGLLLYNDMYINLKGFYDPESMNFTFSGAAGNYAFEFFGTAKETDDGIALAAGKIKTKNSFTGEWTEELVSFELDSSILFSGTAQTPATGLPAEWVGIWECWSDGSEGAPFNGNAQLAEQWRTMQEGYLVVTPYSLGFWFDIDEVMRDIIEYADTNYQTYGYSTVDEYIEYFRMNYLQCMADFSVVEVEKIDDSTYDVITLNKLYGWGDEDDEYVYRKLRFMQGDGEYSDELWIVFCTFDDEDPWSTYTSDAEEARAGDNFSYDRENWGDYVTYTAEETNYTLFVAKR